MFDCKADLPSRIARREPKRSIHAEAAGLANGVGVIDSDYRGEICVGLCNVSDKPYTVEPFERVAQMVIAPVIVPTVTEVSELSDTERGEGGFGSTGTK